MTRQLTHIRCATLVGLTFSILLINANFIKATESEPPLDATKDTTQQSIEADTTIQNEFDFLQEQLQPETVFSAARTAQKASEAPAIVTVFTKEDIQRWGYTSIADLLHHVAGFYVVDDYIFPNVAVRGISGGLRSQSGIVKVMIDSQPVAARLTGGNWLGAELIPLSVVERVEIIRGPASALYGADAFLGVINIVTRDGGDLGGVNSILRGQVTDKTGNLGGDMDGGFGFKRGDWDVLVAGRFQKLDYSGLKLPSSSPAPQIFPYRQDNLVASGLDQSSGVGFLKVGWRPNETTVVTTRAYYSEVDRGGDFADWFQLAHGVDPQGRALENRIAQQQGWAQVELASTISDRVKLNFSGLYFLGGPGARNRIEVGSDLYYIKEKYQYQGGQLGGTVDWSILPNLNVLGGFDFIYDEERLPIYLHILKAETEDHQAGDAITSISSPHPIVAFLDTGIYLQAQWSPIKEFLNLTGGIRYDYHSIYYSQFSSRAAAVSTVLENLHLKLLYGSAFKAPSPLLLYGIPLKPDDIMGNPKLKPQQVHTFEFQIVYQPWSNFTVKTDLSYSLLLNQAEFTQLGVNQVARNLAEVGSLSWETELQLVVKRYLRGYLNFTLQHTVRDVGLEGYVAQLTSEGNPIYPPWFLQMGVDFQVPGIPLPPDIPLRLTLEGLLASARQATDANVLQNASVYNLPLYFLLGISVGLYNLHPIDTASTSIRIAVRNVLNARGPDPGFGGIDYPLQPRTFMLEIWQEIK